MLTLLVILTMPLILARLTLIPIKSLIFFFQAEDGIRDGHVTGVQTCALPISARRAFLRRTWNGWRRRSGSTSAHVPQRRSEERRVGKECRSRWSPYH